MKRRTCGAFRRGAVDQRSVCGKRLRATEQLASASGKDPSDSCGGGGMFAISSRHRTVVAFELIFRLKQAIGKGEGVLFHKPPNLAAYTALSSSSSRYNSLLTRHSCGVVRILCSSSAIAKKTVKSRLFCYGGGGGIRTLEPLLTVTRFPVVRPRPN